MILCVGTTPTAQRTLVFERLQLDAVNRAAECYDTASGKSINVARVIHTLGEACIATGFLGGDVGKYIRDELSAAGIAHDFVEVAPKTRTCVTVMDRSSGHATELVEESKLVETDAWAKLKSKIEQLASRAKLIVLSGSLPPGAPQDFYAWCVKLGVRTIVDAAGGPLKRALDARPFLVKPNRQELAKTLGVSVDSDDSLRDAVTRLNADWVVVTEGRSGAIVSDGTTLWRLHAPKVVAINPIGSGDSLAAGIATALVRGETMPDAAKLGIACGAANAMTTTSGVVDPATVKELLTQVFIEQI